MAAYNMGVFLGSLCICAVIGFGALLFLVHRFGQERTEQSIHKNNAGVTIITTTYPPDWSEYQSFLLDEEAHNL